MTIPRKKTRINVEIARNHRNRGLSYAEIAYIMRVSPTGVYRALNPKPRKGRALVTKRSASIYMDVVWWDELARRAQAARVSSSQYAVLILLGELPPLALDPTIPGATDEQT